MITLIMIFGPVDPAECGHVSMSELPYSRLDEFKVGDAKEIEFILKIRYVLLSLASVSILCSTPISHLV